MTLVWQRLSAEGGNSSISGSQAGQLATLCSISSHFGDALRIYVKSFVCHIKLFALPRFHFVFVFLFFSVSLSLLFLHFLAHSFFSTLLCLTLCLPLKLLFGADDDSDANVNARWPRCVALRYVSPFTSSVNAFRCSFRLTASVFSLTHSLTLSLAVSRPVLCLSCLLSSILQLRF